MKKILLIIIIILTLILGYILVTHDLNPNTNKVYSWAKEYIPEQIAKFYTITDHDIVKNDDGSIDVTLHFEKNDKSEHDGEALV